MHDKHIQSSGVPVTEFISTVLSEALFCDFSVHCCFQYATFLHSFSKVCLQPHFTIQKDKGSEKQQSLSFFLFKQNRVFSRSVHLESHRASLPLPCPQGSSFLLLCPSSMLLHALSLHRTLHNCIISTLPCPLISSYAHLLSPF